MVRPLPEECRKQDRHRINLIGYLKERKGYVVIDTVSTEKVKNNFREIIIRRELTCQFHTEYN